MNINLIYLYLLLGQPSGGLGGGGLFSSGLGQSSGLGFSGKNRVKIVLFIKFLKLYLIFEDSLYTL